MAYDDVTFTNIYGLHGNFKVGSGEDSIKVSFLETKVRPGSQGNWTNMLATNMVPWREVFDIEDMSFDELLQRDLNDSRVANDLIPYLISSNGRSAKFFPPILAVMVPKDAQRNNIEKHYPTLDSSIGVQKYGDLFDFEYVLEGDKETPFARIGYNPQKTSFIIVDGQHRAMAILALHRELTGSWQNSKFQSYYSHIEVNAEDLQNLELPVCLLYFPELHKGNADVLNKGVALDRACRELFLVVNRTAQPVSAARQLLLDDDDFGAHLMRRTLSGLKGRKEDDMHISRIYSFRYGDSEDVSRTVVSGITEYCSAVVLHKMHCIASFGQSGGLNILEPEEITDGRKHQNPTRPVSLLHGKIDKWPSISRRSGRVHDSSDVEEIVQYLGNINDYIIFSLFDSFWPFRAHNYVFRTIKNDLETPQAKSNEVQSKCHNLLFEGSGVKGVFEEHFERLKSVKKELEVEGREVNQYVLQQIVYSQTVLKALESMELKLKDKRACTLFNLNYDSFFDDSENKQDERLTISKAAASIYDTVSTQAFQIGFLMTVLTLVEKTLDEDTEYDCRLGVVRYWTDTVIKLLNNYFEPPEEEALRMRVGGLIRENRIDVFNTSKEGLRSLLSMSVIELNEKQWPFFRYCILELMFSKYNNAMLQMLLKNSSISSQEHLKSVLLDVAKDVKSVRDEYVSRGVKRGITLATFQQQLNNERARLEGAGHEEEEIERKIAVLEKDERDRLITIAKQYVKASVGALNSIDKWEDD